MLCVEVLGRQWCCEWHERQQSTTVRRWC